MEARQQSQDGARWRGARAMVDRRAGGPVTLPERPTGGSPEPQSVNTASAAALTYEQEVHSLMWRGKVLAADLAGIFERDANAAHGESRRLLNLSATSCRDDERRFAAMIEPALARSSGALREAPPTEQERAERLCARLEDEATNEDLSNRVCDLLVQAAEMIDELRASGALREAPPSEPPDDYDVAGDFFAQESVTADADQAAVRRFVAWLGGPNPQNFSVRLAPQGLRQRIRRIAHELENASYGLDAAGVRIPESEPEGKK